MVFNWPIVAELPSKAQETPESRTHFSHWAHIGTKSSWNLTLFPMCLSQGPGQAWWAEPPGEAQEAGR